MEEETFTNRQLEIGELPRWEAVAFEPLAKTAPWESFFQSLIGFGVLLLLTVVGLAVMGPPLPVSLAALAGVLLLFGLVQWHTFAEHRLRGVAVRERDILFRSGLFWQQRSVVPFNRVQHIETHRNPIERQLGLSSLRIFTAGGGGVDLQIKGLEEARADQLKRYILERAKIEGTEG